MTKEKKGRKCKMEQGKGDENYIVWQVSVSQGSCTRDLLTDFDEINLTSS